MVQNTISVEKIYDGNLLPGFWYQPYHTTTRWCSSFDERDGVNSKDQLGPCSLLQLWVILHGLTTNIQATLLQENEMSKWQLLFKKNFWKTHVLILSCFFASAFRETFFFCWGLIKVKSRLQVCGNQFQSQSRALLEWKTPGKPRRSSVEI